MRTRLCHHTWLAAGAILEGFTIFRSLSSFLLGIIQCNMWMVYQPRKYIIYLFQVRKSRIIHAPLPFHEIRFLQPKAQKFKFGKNSWWSVLMLPICSMELKAHLMNPSQERAALQEFIFLTLEPSSLDAGGEIRCMNVFFCISLPSKLKLEELSSLWLSA